SLSELCPAEPPFPVPDLLLAPKLPVTDSLDLMPALATTAPRELPEPALDDIAALNYTGGTTGLPKGCIHTHADMRYTCASFLPGARQAAAPPAAGNRRPRLAGVAGHLRAPRAARTGPGRYRPPPLRRRHHRPAQGLHPHPSRHALQLRQRPARRAGAGQGQG